MTGEIGSHWVERHDVTLRDPNDCSFSVLIDAALHAANRDKSEDAPCNSQDLDDHSNPYENRYPWALLLLVGSIAPATLPLLQTVPDSVAVTFLPVYALVSAAVSSLESFR